ncbi:hypothetical protein C1I92_32775, partial [Jiangella anatolica]
MAGVSRSKLELRRAVSRRLAASRRDRDNRIGQPAAVLSQPPTAPTQPTARPAASPAQTTSAGRSAAAADRPQRGWAARLRAAVGGASAQRETVDESREQPVGAAPPADPVDAAPPADPVDPAPPADPVHAAPPADPVHAAPPADPGAEEQSGPAWIRARDSLRRLTASRLDELDQEPAPAAEAPKPEPEPREQSGPAWIRARDALRQLTTSRLEQLGDERPSAEPAPRHDAQEVVPWARRDAMQRLTVIRLERLDEPGTDAGHERHNGTAPGDAATSEPAHERASDASWGGRLRYAARGRRARPASEAARTDTG